MKHIRTIQGVIDYLHEQDTDCAVTAHCLRQLVKSGNLPYRMAGSKYLLAVEDVVAYFNREAQAAPGDNTPEYG